jgi:hypothetical protein
VDSDNVTSPSVESKLRPQVLSKGVSESRRSRMVQIDLRRCVTIVSGMQDRYVGDVGDYLKLGLLRWLTTGTPAPRLGVVWYRTPDEAHNADGKHIAYLRSDHAAARMLRQFDPDLYDRLAELVADGRRSVVDLSAAGTLPATTVYFDDHLDLADLPIGARVERTERRTAWLARALSATKECDLIFADPDNGIRSTAHSVGPHRNRSIKHAYLNELAAFTTNGQSLVVYHHADRSAPTIVQAQRRLSDLAREAGVEPIAAVRASRGSTRLFLVAAPPATQTGRVLADRLHELDNSSWGQELTIHWAN